MTVQDMATVFERSTSSGNTRLVLLAIANHHGERGAWPSVDRLASEANVSRRTVQRAIAEAVEIGELEVLANEGRHGTNVYLLTVASAGGRQIDTRDKPGPDLSPNTYEPRTTPKPKVKSMAADAAFGAFYDQIYPRKAKRPAAKRAWDRALRRGVDPAAILAGAERYRDDPNREQAYTAHPATWLNDEAWDDPPLPSRTQASLADQLDQRRAARGTA